jgi:hypothetical protein
VEVHRRLLDGRAVFGDGAGVRLFERLVEVEARLVLVELWQVFLVVDGYAVRDNVAGQAAVVDGVERRVGRAVAGDAGDEERVAGVAGARHLRLPVLDGDLCLRRGRHRQRRDGDDARDGRARHNLAVGQRARPRRGSPVAVERRALLKHVVHTPV